MSSVSINIFFDNKNKIIKNIFLYIVSQIYLFSIHNNMIKLHFNNHFYLLIKALILDQSIQINYTIRFILDFSKS